MRFGKTPSACTAFWLALSRAARFLTAFAVLAAPGRAAVTIDYPREGSIFPPEFAPPTFTWHDGDRASARWRIDISFADGSAAIHTTSRGQPPRIGEIDPDCVADTNEAPKLTAEEAAAHTWMPDRAMWEAIKRHSVAGAATVTISSAGGRAGVRIRTSRDPAGAPIFYRDVPLMPSEVERGVIKPLAASAVPLVAWRVRDLAESSSRVVLDSLPVCANCHSFSADGKTLGMDLDGLENNRGLYLLAPVGREISVGRQNLVQWSTAEGALKGNVRVGFLSQVSPDGRYVVTTIDPRQKPGARDASTNYYVANFKDYRFLQVFYPTRGILSWYSQATGILQPLAGADDPRFVQMGAVWSPEGQYLVFARAAARDPDPPGVPLARFANDPNELPIQYDLYRIPFRGGKGGQAEPIAGASRNGMSNSFPKVSPDGKWIVFVEARNGMLMRPDSQLYIVPAGGGTARRMRSNTSRMNSWHSFSPNGRWLVFSSKARSPYTDMYLTHIDEDGSDSPPILVENSKAANRAVNLPEFVNIAPQGLRAIGGPALDYYKLVNRAMYLQKQRDFAGATAAWREVLQISPDDALAAGNLGSVLLMAGQRGQAGVELRKAAELKWRTTAVEKPGDADAWRNLGRIALEDGRIEEAVHDLRRAAEVAPASAAAHGELGAALARAGRLDAALPQLRKSVVLDPKYAAGYYNLGLVLERMGEPEAAMRQWEETLRIDPRSAEAHDSLARALYERGRTAEALPHWREGTGDAAALRQEAWALATDPAPAVRNGQEALALAVRSAQMSDGKDAAVWDTLAAAYAETGRFEDAAATAARALALAEQGGQRELAEAIRGRIRLYQTGRPFREKPGGRR